MGNLVAYVLAAAIASMALINYFDNDAMKECQKSYSYDTCHNALYR